MRTYEVVFYHQGAIAARLFETATNPMQAEYMARNQAPYGLVWDTVEATQVGG